MKYIVTGARGFIASNLIQHLLASGEHVVGVSREPYYTSKPNCVFVGWDNEQLNKVIACGDVIIHLAGSSSISQSLHQPTKEIEETVSVLNKILMLTREKSVKFVYVSSGAVGTPNIDGLVPEDCSIRPRSPYAAAKAACEAIVHSYVTSYGLDACCVRLFSVYGPTMKQFFIYDAVKKIQQSSSAVHFFGSGEQQRDYLYITDVVHGLYKLSNNFTKGEIINLCSGKPRSVKSIANAIKVILRKDDVQIIFDAQNLPFQRDIFYGELSNKMLIKNLKINKFEESLEKTVKVICDENFN